MLELPGTDLHAQLAKLRGGLVSRQLPQRLFEYRALEVVPCNHTIRVGPLALCNPFDVAVSDAFP